MATIEGECPHIARTIQRAEKQESRNRLRVDAVETGTARCSLRTPSHWPESATGFRWLMSGGDAYVFGHCVGREAAECPLNKEKEQP